MSQPLSRRDLFRILAGAGLAGCDSGQPRRGLLGAMERWNQGVESFLLSDREPVVTAPLTPMDAIPNYHVAPTTPIAPDDWKLIVSGKVARPLAFTLDELRQLPRIDVRIRHHCVEGWSVVADWTGVRISELARIAGARDVGFVEFRSFDIPAEGARGYWSSWDRRSAMHPHTMLAYGMNGRPLLPEHGAPVRLYGSVKLGYKMVKYVTEVSFLDVETGGYWENRGYEWFAGV